MAETGVGLVDELLARRSAVERELEEIELLTRQARTEADRHATRREAAAQRLAVLMDEGSVPQQVREAHDQLMLQYQRSALMTAQIEVLEGKQKVLQRLHEGLGEATTALGAAGAANGKAVTAKPTPGGGGGGVAQPAGAQSRAVLDAQEEMRRAIARQMHDGPAQSIANIALQAEIVQRLLARDPQAASSGLAELRSMVQHALDATKSFIFEVRPMVLDDLGLVPTLRRAAGERQRRSALPVRFESVGTDRRLDPQLETQLFRIVDDTVAAFLAHRPEEVALRLNWTETDVTLAVTTRPPASAASTAGVPSGPSAADVPTALAAMIRDQHAGEAERENARRRAYAVPAEALESLQQRAEAAGIALVESGDGLRIEARVATAIGTTT